MSPLIITQRITMLLNFEGSPRTGEAVSLPWTPGLRRWPGINDVSHREEVLRPHVVLQIRTPDLASLDSPPRETRFPGDTIEELDPYKVSPGLLPGDGPGLPGLKLLSFSFWGRISGARRKT